MKRLLAILLVASFAVAPLAGCKKDDSSKAGPRVRVPATAQPTKGATTRPEG